jgi:hypothetical protein
MENAVASQSIWHCDTNSRELRATTLACLSSVLRGVLTVLMPCAKLASPVATQFTGQFELWLQEAGAMLARARRLGTRLALEEFAAHAADYFRAGGMGTRAQFGSEDNDGVATVAVENCWETDPCRFGGIAVMPSERLECSPAFFGKLAGYPSL